MLAPMDSCFGYFTHTVSLLRRLCILIQYNTTRYLRLETDASVLFSNVQKKVRLLHKTNTDIWSMKARNRSQNILLLACATAKQPFLIIVNQVFSKSGKGFNSISKNQT